jgi:Cytochrome c oxidase subunit IV
MSDDAALLLRVAVFGVVAAVVYWFLSYEALGTVALLVLGGGPGFAALFLLRHRKQPGTEQQTRAEMLRRFAGVPSGDPPGPKQLEDEDLAVLPAASIWPAAASLGVAVAGSGLIFGLWLVILGLGVALYAGWGWIAAIVRETRYGHIHPTDRPEADEDEEEPAPEEPLRRR